MPSEAILTTQPFLVIYVVWHPKFSDGEQIARTLFNHYRRNLYENVAGGGGLPIVYRSTPAPGSTTPLKINLDDARTSAIVLLLDQNWADDASWVTWAKQTTEQAEVAGLSARVFPVAIDAAATQIGMVTQAARWDKWCALSDEDRNRSTGCAPVHP
jgi:hypothetical protein